MCVIFILTALTGHALSKDLIFRRRLDRLVGLGFCFEQPVILFRILDLLVHRLYIELRHAFDFFLLLSLDALLKDVVQLLKLHGIAPELRLVVDIVRDADLVPLAADVAL